MSACYGFHATMNRDSQRPVQCGHNKGVSYTKCMHSVKSRIGSIRLFFILDGDYRG